MYCVSSVSVSCPTRSSSTSACARPGRIYVACCVRRNSHSETPDIRKCTLGDCEPMGDLPCSKWQYQNNIPESIEIQRASGRGSDANSILCTYCLLATHWYRGFEAVSSGSWDPEDVAHQYFPIYLKRLNICTYGRL